MGKFISVTPPVSRVQIIINPEQVLYIKREHVNEEFKREITKIIFRDNTFIYVEDSIEKLAKKINMTFQALGKDYFCINATNNPYSWHLCFKHYRIRTGSGFNL